MQYIHGTRFDVQNTKYKVEGGIQYQLGINTQWLTCCKDMARGCPWVGRSGGQKSLFDIEALVALIFPNFS